MSAIGTTSAPMPSRTRGGGRSFPARDGSGELPRGNAPRKACAIDPRIRHIVQAAPTSIAPTAMGRTSLYQMENTSSESGGGPCGPARRGGGAGGRKKGGGGGGKPAGAP